MVDVRFRRAFPVQAPAPSLLPEEMTGPVMAGPNPYQLHRIRYRPEETTQTTMVREYEPIPGDHQSLQAALAAAPPGRYFAVGRPGDDPARLVAWFKCHDGTCYRGNIR